MCLLFGHFWGKIGLLFVPTSGRTDRDRGSVSQRGRRREREKKVSGDNLKA